MALVVVRLSRTIYPQYAPNHSCRPTSLSSCLLRLPRVPPLLAPLRPPHESESESESRLCDTLYANSTSIIPSYIFFTEAVMYFLSPDSGISIVGCLFTCHSWDCVVPKHQGLHVL